MNKHAKPISLLLTVCALAASSTLQNISTVRADTTGPLNFESYTLGNINGQDGWNKTNAAFDVAVVANSYGYSTFGTQSLRLSDAVTSGSFGDQTFAKPLIDAVGETGATAGIFSVGTRQQRFETQFDIASTSPTQQPGMHVSFSPDRGDGSRMSYLRFDDKATGIEVFFSDTPGTTNPANFNETSIGILDRAVSHRIKLTLDTIDGPSNDIVKVWIDGVLVHTGTSWENYYRYDTEAIADQHPRIVRTVLFRESGTANPADAGKGFLVDNLTMTSGPIPPPPPPSITLVTANNNAFCGSDTKVVDVNFDMSAVTSLYGYQFDVHFDPTNLELVANSAVIDNSWFSNATPSAIYDPYDSGLGGVKANTSTPGTIRFAASKAAPETPKSGAGKVATMSFKGLHSGIYPLTLVGAVLSDKDGTPLNQTLGTVNLTVCGFASISGKVSLQGRAIPGPELVLSPDIGTVMLTDGIGGSYSTTIDQANGTYSISNIKALAGPGGTSYTWKASHWLYLDNQKVQILKDGDTLINQDTKLLGGDATNNKSIDIGDLACIAGQFNRTSSSTPPMEACGTGWPNINNDVAGVNIQDLAIAGGNYGLTGPQLWP